ncbi:MAG TPA: serine/threonine-protein kinase, partial [Vicinamibacterales bacterium]|nr:serine/threonine-protein kinase [Vicinamibacterales bacterium]
MTCPRCGEAAAGGARFCASCGQPLRTSSGDSTTAAPRVPDRGDDVTRLASPDERKPSSSGWLTSSDSISHGRFTPGTILDGRYRIIGLLGKGGMGEVYRADDLRLGQPVALKFLPPDIGRDALRLAQFHNEVRMARLVSHPNICRVFDIGEFEGQLFLSMEYVDGEDLATSLRRIGRFPEDKATEIARQICAGLAAAHDRRVLHRDLKPANVMIDGAGKVRLMDFGLAASGVVEDVRAGTPAYMAPEQLGGRDVTARSDIFALGLVLYELFTGRRAFTAESLNELVNQHQAGLVTPPRSVLSTIDPAVERAILRCLEPDPASRPSSALAVSAALPGGDPLAAALAAGETPSPAMVAAAGEGAGIGGRVAIPVYVASVAGIVAAYALTVTSSPLSRLRPELTAEVLAQKAREAVRQIGYLDRPRDEAYGFEWDVEVVDYIRENDVPSPRWEQVLSNRPSPLRFWYRRSPAPMTAVEFHHDLLTPGIVTPHDPAPIVSGMIQMTLDHQGLLTFFEAIPQQVRTGDGAPAAIDWTALFTLAGLDPGELEPAAPRWNWLA